jgi:hypothetical protein
VQVNKNEKVRHNNKQPLKEILSEIIGQPVLSKGIGETLALRAWEAVLGKPVARITTNIYIKNGILYVWLNSSVVRSELYLNKMMIIKAINDYIGAHIVNDIVLR